MKHSRISLLERAAEVYDFAAALRRVPPRNGADQVSRAPQGSALPGGDLDMDHPKPQATDGGGADTAFYPAPEAAPAHPPGPHAEAYDTILDLNVPAGPAAPAEAAVARRHAPAATAIVDRVGLAERGYIVPEATVTGLAEEFRLIKRQLLARIDRMGALPEEKRRSVLVCSAQPKEGKSFCAVNLALSLAGEREIEVLLVDGDFTKPDVPAVLGLEPDRPGLVDALADGSDPEAFVIRTDVPGLSVLPAGRKQNNVPELLASGRTREVLARLIAGDSRRIIIFDSPPALMASPATVLAGHVGQVLVVVRADQTTEADLRETIGLLSGCDHVALMLNGAAIAVSGRNYGAYDGYGHAD